MAKSQKLQVVDSQLPAELLTVAESSGIIITEAQIIGMKFAPYMQKVNEISLLIAGLEKENPTEEDAALARKWRLELVKNRGIEGLKTVHENEKSGILVKVRLIDNLKNAVENSSIMSETVAMNIEKHRERIEKEKQDKLAVDRAELLLPYETDTEFLPLGTMTDEQFEKLLAKEKESFEAVTAKRLKDEAERIEAEKLAEEQRLAEIEKEKERQKQIEIDNARLKKEAEAREKELAKERAENEKKEAIRVRRNKEMMPYITFIRDYKAMLELPEAEYQKQLRDTNQAAMDQAKYDGLKAIENERKEQELAETKKALQAKQEQEEREKQQAIAEQQERDAQAKAALLAPDKEKVRALYEAIKAIQIPEFSSAEAIQIGKDIAEGLEILRKGLIEKSKVLA